MSWTGASLPREVEMGSLLTSMGFLGAGLVIFEALDADVGFVTGLAGALTAVLPGVVGPVVPIESLFLALPIGLR